MSSLLAAAQINPVIQGLVSVAALFGFVIWLKERRGQRDSHESVEAEVQRAGRVERRLGDVMIFGAPHRLGVIRRSVDRSGLVDRAAATLETRPITADVEASVEAAGNVSVTRGRNLAAKALGAALVPGGLFVFGNAKETVHDHRELYLIIEAKDWAITLAVNPVGGLTARDFASAVNVCARAQRPVTPEPQVVASVSTDVLDQLERLTKLRDAGTLSADEFAAQKSLILAAG